MLVGLFKREDSGVGISPSSCSALRWAGDYTLDTRGIIIGYGPSTRHRARERQGTMKTSITVTVTYPDGTSYRDVTSGIDDPILLGSLLATEDTTPWVRPHAHEYPVYPPGTDPWGPLPLPIQTEQFHERVSHAGPGKQCNAPTCGGALCLRVETRESIAARGRP